MFYRLLCLLVVVFWLTMSALLIRTELSTGKSPLRAVPIEHVLKLLFRHEQQSDLNIYSDRTRFGHLRIHPRVDKETGHRILEFSGALQLRLPTLPKQRFLWDGAVEMDPAFATQRFRFGFTMLEPTNYRAETQIEPPAKRMHVLVRTTAGISEETFTLDEKGAWQLMEHFGVDPEVVQTFTRDTTINPEITAQQSSLRVHGERMETYLVTIQQSGQTLLEFHVDQLGKILQAKTLVGYTLTPDELVP